MPRETIRTRLRRKGEPRYLTDGEAEALLTAQKVVNGPVVWVDQADSRFTRMSVAVTNALGETVKLVGRVNRAHPGRSGWTLIWGTKRDGEHPECLRRLDLRDTHRNPDGEFWERRTHKHRWSEADNNDWAYTPDDIPHDQTASVVVADDYRAIFEAFAAECGVALGPDYEWTEPVLTVPVGQDGLWNP